MNKSVKFHELLKREGMIVAPGAYDAISAKIIDYHKFDAVYVTGFGVSAALLGKPDLGLISLGEMVNQLDYINSAVNIPVIADAESGFGNVLNVARTVELYEQIGIAAFHIEDQFIPKRYKPDGLPQVDSCKSHCEKISVAAAVRKNKSTCIIARTDALSRYGISEAIKRANSYGEAGADMVFIHSASMRNELELIIREVKFPNIVNYSTLRESANVSIPSLKELEEMGFKLCILAGEGLFSAVRAIDLYLDKLNKYGIIEELDESFISLKKFFKIIGIDKFLAIEKKHLPKNRK